MTSIYKSEEGRLAVEAFYRKALQRWPVANQQLTIPTRHGNTFVVVCGEPDATPVVLLHGSGANSAVWMHDVADWAARYRVYAIDVIGEPGFSAPSRPALASDAYAVWLDDVWNALGLARASVVGVSLGGWLALDYAIRRPARVTSLSLLSPAGIGSRNPWLMVKALLLMTLGPFGVRRSLELVSGKTGAPREVAEYVMTVFRHFRPRTEKVPIRTDEELSQITMPVQLIVGGRDSMIRSRETRDRAQRLLRNLHLTYLDDEGHLLPRQTTRIADFVQHAT